MSALMSTVPRRGLHLSKCLRKEARLYPPDQTWSEAIERKGTKKPWQKVFFKGRDPMDKKIRKMQLKDFLVSDPDRAARVSDAKMEALKSSLLMRGFARERKPYAPPNNVEEVLKRFCTELFVTVDPDSWLELPLTDPVIKFKLLTRCEESFNHQIANSELHRIVCLGDVLEYYTTPVRGISSYDQLVRDQEKLPTNLHVIAESVRFDPEFFGGLDAYPKRPLVSTGLRAAKKYPDLKVPFQWPDV